MVTANPLAIAEHVPKHLTETETALQKRELEDWIVNSIQEALTRFGLGDDVEVVRSPMAQRIVEGKYAGIAVFGAVVAAFLLAMLGWFWLRFSSELQSATFRRRQTSSDDERSVSTHSSCRGTLTSEEANPSDTPASAEALVISVIPLRYGLYEVIMARYNMFLFLVPLGWLSYWLHWGVVATFILNLLAIVPLATLTGEATEELAMALGSGPTIGGLINASFGNAVEIIIMFQTLRHGQLEATKGALLGSILINDLLVLGAAMFFGGLLKRDDTSWQAALGKEQAFSSSTARMLAQVLVFSAFCLSMPSIFGLQSNEDEESTLLFSRSGSAVVLVGYSAFLIFQLGTHTGLMKGVDSEEEELPRLSVKEAFALLVACTAAVALSSHYMVHEMGSFVRHSGMPSAFIYVILLPFVGNACEHAVAVIAATRDKMDLAIGIGVGSAIQMALFATPLMVVMGWILDQPMDLNFHPRNAFTLVLSSLMVSGTLTLRRTNWLLGSLLMGAYMLLMVLYYFSLDGPL